jgi:hypothetical protein
LDSSIKTATAFPPSMKRIGKVANLDIDKDGDEARD